MINDGGEDQRADLFSVGVLAWELLCNRPLFAGTTAEALSKRVCAAAIRRADALKPAGGEPVPEVIATVIAQALERNVEERFETAADMAAALAGEEVASHEQVTELLRMLASESLDKQRTLANGVGPHLGTPDEEVLATLEADEQGVNSEAEPDEVQSLVDDTCPGADETPPAVVKEASAEPSEDEPEPESVAPLSDFDVMSIADDPSDDDDLPPEAQKVLDKQQAVVSKPPKWLVGAGLAAVLVVALVVVLGKDDDSAAPSTGPADTTAPAEVVAPVKQPPPAAAETAPAAAETAPAATASATAAAQVTEDADAGADDRTDDAARPKATQVPKPRWRPPPKSAPKYTPGGI